MKTSQCRPLKPKFHTCASLYGILAVHAVSLRVGMAGCMTSCLQAAHCLFWKPASLPVDAQDHHGCGCLLTLCQNRSTYQVSIFVVDSVKVPALAALCCGSENHAARALPRRPRRGHLQGPLQTRSWFLMSSAAVSGFPSPSPQLPVCAQKVTSLVQYQSYLAYKPLQSCRNKSQRQPSCVHGTAGAVLLQSYGNFCPRLVALLQRYRFPRHARPA